MLALGINLDAQKERWNSLKKFCQSINVKLQKISAVDGNSCLKSGGRCVQKTKLNFRLAYDSGQKRLVFNFRPGKLGANGCANIWAQFGCAQSHVRATRKMLTCLRNNHYDYILIFEDDICISSEVQPAVFLHTLLKKLGQLEKRYPNFCALSLGGKPCVTTATGNGPTTIAGVCHATRVLQAHAYVWRWSPDLEEVVTDYLHRLHTNGQVVDNALACCQRHFSNHFFFLSPGWVLQNPAHGSSLQLTGASGSNAGYQHALKQIRDGHGKSQKKVARQNLPATIRAALGQTRRGIRKISKKKLKRLRQEEGAKGGHKRAGNGSSLADIKKKEKSMLNYFNRTGQVPSKRFAAETWGLSQCVWSRTAKLCV